MGLADRDYMQGDAGGRPTMGPGFAGGPANWSVTTWLIVINVAVFVLDGLLVQPFAVGPVYAPVGVRVVNNGTELVRQVVFDGMRPMQGYGFFSVYEAISRLQLWRFLGFQFLHAGLGHLFGNMLGLWVFGSFVEDVLGSRKFLVFYLLCGLGGPVAYMIFWSLGVLVATPYTPLIGASAGVYGVLIAATAVAPRMRMQMLFPPVEIELRTLAWILLGVATYTLFFQGSDVRSNAGGEAAHLGGAALGFLMIRNRHALDFVDRWRLRLPGYRPQTRSKYMRYRP